tara:strand:- start:582 stop:755 length:174 start_codon:yes stop_codon:yes gene_type:complete
MDKRKLIIILGLIIVSLFAVFKLVFSDHRTQQQIDDENRIESGDFDVDDLENMDFGF